MIDLLEYHAASGPCGTISPRSVRFSYISVRRADRVRKANRVSLFSKKRKLPNQGDQNIVGDRVTWLRYNKDMVYV